MLLNKVMTILNKYMLIALCLLDTVSKDIDVLVVVLLLRLHVPYIFVLMVSISLAILYSCYGDFLACC